VDKIESKSAPVQSVPIKMEGVQRTYSNISVDSGLELIERIWDTPVGDCPVNNKIYCTK
jgi:hypothetical protein